MKTSVKVLRYFLSSHGSQNILTKMSSEYVSCSLSARRLFHSFKEQSQEILPAPCSSCCVAEHWVTTGWLHFPSASPCPCSVLSSQYYVLIRMNNGRIHPEIWKYSKPRLHCSLICTLWPISLYTEKLQCCWKTPSKGNKHAGEKGRHREELAIKGAYSAHLSC